MSTQVWSIINATPDSFFGESRAQNDDQTIHLASRALTEGGTLLDIGAMSTRPGFKEISPSEEFARLERVVGTIKTHFPQAALSIDTYRADVVKKAHSKFGRFIVNDISGSQADPDMLTTVAELDLPYVMMSQDSTIDEMIAFFERTIQRAQKIGVRQIIIDPGFGFGKNLEQNFEILRNINKLKQLGREILIGISRKSMIFKTLGTTPELSLEGTTALHFAALMQGADILRVHDTLAATQTIKLYETYTGNDR